MAENKNQNLSLSNLGDMQILAQDIKKFIQENKLSTNVQGKEFPQSEAWQYAGNRIGVIPQAGICECISNEQEIKYRASVILVDINNNYAKVGRGYAVCSNKEQGKKYYQEFAIASMAQTRAIGKAYRIMLSFLMRLAGYEPTPAEEMDYGGNEPTKPAPQTPQKEEQSTTPAPAESSPQEAETAQIKYASAKQKEDIIRLLNNPVITRPEKSKMLLNLGKLDEERAGQVIIKLEKVIDEREKEPAT